MPLSDDLADVAHAYVLKLEQNMAYLGLEAVFYGDQNTLPTTPVACVEPDTDDEVLRGAQRVVDITFIVHILLYHSSVTSPQTNRRLCDQMATSIKRLINADPELRLGATGPEDALAIHCYVTNIASGYSTKGSTLVRSSKITVEVKSRAILLSS